MFIWRETYLKDTSPYVDLPVSLGGRINSMSKSYLQVTYRQGKPFAAFLYLGRPGDRAEVTKREIGFVVDYSSDGRPIGIEFTSITSIDLAAINRVLHLADQTEISARDLAPLTAA
jgi:hypothetical protein